MVELIQNNWHQLESELRRWWDILAVPWARAKNKQIPSGAGTREVIEL